MLERKSSPIWLSVFVTLSILFLAAMPAIAASGVLADPAPAEGQMLAHMVYFSLKDASEGAKSRLVGACRKYLKDHPGIVFFAAGVLAEDMKRDVNVTDFDVALHIVFRSKADHDRYQAADAHQQFIKENQANWARVRVLDSYVK